MHTKEVYKTPQTYYRCLVSLWKYKYIYNFFWLLCIHFIVWRFSFRSGFFAQSHFSILMHHQYYSNSGSQFRWSEGL